MTDGEREGRVRPGFDRAAWWLGVRRAIALPAWIVAAGLMGVGPLARDAGFPLGAAVLSTLLVWAGPAQIILFGMAGAGAAWPAVILAVSLSGMRLMPMTMTILTLLRPGRPNWSAQMLAAHCTAITVWVEGLRRLPGMPPEQRMPYYLGFAATCILVSAAATGVGYVASGIVPYALVAVLLFVSPVFFLLSLVDGARRIPDFTALAAGFVLAPPAILWLGQGMSLLAVGLTAGTVAWLIDRTRRRR